jgi:hypothetical protein
MKTIVQSWMVRFGLWIAGQGGWVVPVCTLPHTPIINPDLLVAVRQLTRSMDTSPASGEYKRHQVYAALQKLFPDTPKRTLAWAIEIALCG